MIILMNKLNIEIISSVRVCVFQFACVSLSVCVYFCVFLSQCVCVSLSVYVLISVLSIGVRGVLKFPAIIVLLLISPFILVNVHNSFIWNRQKQNA